ncbi:PhoH family protein [Acidimicrobium ferrooxidans DSM 10331]|uniref:PhoH-like protein n=1 Tax=Acidimicrobium ferrooxidans (strain DSM 10331 / JCM 15462 / NBRC 103882 / ICP) TaxID=525909 RepID=C7LZP4_ACIFD|nr:PhoH family protein [Acidimicrobium ferrooxidans]ACU54202.1 PhoH family protein [Acidimicrobium ferrooxidans DSM 10331]
MSAVSSGLTPPLAATRVDVDRPELLAIVFGAHDELLRVLEEAVGQARVVVRDGGVMISGADADLAARVLGELLALAARGDAVEAAVVHRVVEMLRHEQSPSAVSDLELLRTRDGRSLRPRTAGQRRYVEAIQRSTVTFGVGPAGTGKSYLAVAAATAALRAKRVQRIVLTRPAVEAGERLGFLPGDVAAKVDPYLRPLYDALYDLLEPEAVLRLLERGLIEVAPLAFMRGRTLNQSFIILDEAQNTTTGQMKMFLTRIGFGSTAVVTGDATQIDLDGGTSGLLDAIGRLANIPDVSIVRLDRRDIVRHPVVRAILEAYDDDPTAAGSRG